MNKVQLIGLLGKDPELTRIPNGTAKVTFSVATTERWTKDGEKKEKTEWHKCVAWGKLAEIIAQYFNKGNGIYVEGKVTTRSWDAEGGKKYVTEILVSGFEFLPGRSVSNTNVDVAPPQSEGDIPF